MGLALCVFWYFSLADFNILSLFCLLSIFDYIKMGKKKKMEVRLIHIGLIQGKVKKKN